MFTVLAMLVRVNLVSNVKQACLREPFVYTDFEYWVDAIRYSSCLCRFLDVCNHGLVLFAGLTHHVR